ncbi:MAG TPA: hypothetical protein VM869_35735 [Enhygromyxa sp.]|nr:hypothetical protein [Enhygromyxa sp.]
MSDPTPINAAKPSTNEHAINAARDLLASCEAGETHGFVLVAMQLGGNHNVVSVGHLDSRTQALVIVDLLAELLADRGLLHRAGD